MRHHMGNLKSCLRRGCHTFSFLFAASILLAGCGRDTDFLYHRVTPKPEVFSGVHKLKELQGENRVDILFVVDNSASMGSYQQDLIRNADMFINNFVKQGGLDWKMGLLSTDTQNKPFIGFAQGDELTVQTANNVSLFQAAVGRLGLNGDAIEKTFAPIMKWIPQYPNFLRPQAVLALILITDAEEQSQVDPQDFLNFLTQTKGTLKRVVSYGVFAGRDLGCTVGDSQWNYAGSPYEPVIQATNGKVYPLCADFGTNLADLGKDLYSRVSRPSIRLTQRPQLKTLQVNYLGAPLRGGPKEDGGLWIYDFDNNSILFHSLDFAPGENEEVEVVYEVAQ